MALNKPSPPGFLPISLAELNMEVAKCTACPLYLNTHNAVPGAGPVSAPLFFVGEAPGAKEALTGLPFQGASGRLLNELLASVDIPRSAVFITSVVKHRPPNNRDPSPFEIAACSHFLDAQLALVSPALILTLGRHALFALDPSIPTLPTSHGLKYPGSRAPIVPLYHPAAAIYRPRLKLTLLADMIKVKAYLEELNICLSP